MQRLWLLAIAALFCLPLFVNLDGMDLRGDEAAHSYSVERILETGDWLIPRNSPSDNPFVEKPPLKFWIVAAPIALGLLPDNEIGMRIWDAVFASFAFLYVFRIGRLIAGPLCGVAAVLILFIHWPLLFDHGLRSNNMEAPLLLSYCGGIYHYLAWATGASRSRRHAFAVAVFFALGFMVKFVAALFLPAVIGVTTLALGVTRRRLVEDWAVWLGASALSVGLIAPWYLYGNHLFGQGFWGIIFGDQVYTRLTGVLDPSHLRPWSYYFTDIFRWLKLSNSDLLVGIGLALLTFECVRRPTADRLVIFVWFALPLSIISFGTSKLYHYAFPFLPPLALAGGYSFHWIWRHVQGPVVRWVTAREQAGRWPANLQAGPERQTLRRVFSAVAVAAVVVLLWTVAFGSVRIDAGDVRLFRNGSFFRPWMVAVLFGLLAGRMRDVGRFLLVPALLLAAVPAKEYREALASVREVNRPFQSASQCIRAIRSASGHTAPRSLYQAGPDLAFGHHHTFYFRKLGVIERAVEPSAQTLHKYLFDPAQQEPVLVEATWYQAREWPADHRAVRRIQLDETLLLLPGPYGVCAEHR